MLLLLLRGAPPAGFRSFLPLVAGIQGDVTVSAAVADGAAFSASAVVGQGTTAQVGSSSNTARVTAASNTTAVNVGAAQGAASVSGSNPATFNEGVRWRFWFGPDGMGLSAGSVASVATVTGAQAVTIVRTGAAFSGALVSGYNASAGGQEAFRWRPWLGVDGSLPSLPVGASSSFAGVEGQGVYSILGDYATPLRSVFDIPPPADFKPPGTTLDYGLPTSLRAPGSVSGDIRSDSSATGQLRAVIVSGAGVSSASSGTGQLRAVIVSSGAAASASQVSAVALGVITTVATGSAFAAAAVTGRDGSLAPGVQLGAATADSNASGQARLGIAGSGASASVAQVGAVNASSYPLAAPAGSSSSFAMVGGEAVATIVRSAAAQGMASVAALQATLAIAQAAATSMAVVSGVDGAFTTVAPGGRWPRRPRHPHSMRPGTGNTRRPVSNSS